MHVHKHTLFCIPYDFAHVRADEKSVGGVKAEERDNQEASFAAHQF